jgi:hypothetical protein
MLDSEANPRARPDFAVYQGGKPYVLFCLGSKDRDAEKDTLGNNSNLRGSAASTSRLGLHRCW